ncbi:MAG TPA: tetratricopeptide repeat protein [Candidatus Cloacimonadota bacterium]|nr:tetratricopeptide repeat protein [Candidatus Cloacimonadota bacterium]
MKTLKKLFVVGLVLISCSGLFAQKSKERIAAEFATTADSLFNIKDYANALSEYEKSLNTYKEAITDLTPFDEEIKKVSLNLYITATAAKAYDKAVVWGEKYLELDPNREDIVKNVSVIYAVALKNNQKSLEVLTKFEEKFKTNTAKLAIADRYDRMKDYNNAIIWYKKAYEQSKDSDLFEKIADLYVKLKQNTEAIKTYEDFLASNPSEADLMKTYRNLGTLYNKLKNTNKAIEYFEKVLAIQPDPKVALFLVSSYYDKKDYSNTIKYANIVIENESSNADAIYFRALAYYYSNKKDLAKADFQQVEKNPKYGKSASDFLKLIAQGK